MLSSDENVLKPVVPGLRLATPLLCVKLNGSDRSAWLHRLVRDFAVRIHVQNRFC